MTGAQGSVSRAGQRSFPADPIPAGKLNLPDANKPRGFRRRFVLIDPALIDQQLLYQDSAGKHRIGLILEIERGTDGRFPVRQSAPARLTHAGVVGQVVGHWKFLDPRWDGQGKAAGKGGSAKTSTRKKSADAHT